MVVMIFESVSPSLRGNLSRWMIEPHAGVFVGKLSALVRDELWKMCPESRKGGGMIQIWTAANEQGFDARAYGDTSRQLTDHEGLLLVRRAKARDRRDMGEDDEERHDGGDST
jgi:CRISPR-associated protein Cas2